MARPVEFFSLVVTERSLGFHRFYSVLPIYSISVEYYVEYYVEH